MTGPALRHARQHATAALPSSVAQGLASGSTHTYIRERR